MPKNKKFNSRERLFEGHKKLCAKALETMMKKNADYSAWKSDDAYANFRAFGRMGILVRLSDKLSRLRTFVEKYDGNDDMFAVQDENVKDTIMDAINYLIILGMYEEESVAAA